MNSLGIIVLVLQLLWTFGFFKKANLKKVIDLIPDKQPVKGLGSGIITYQPCPVCSNEENKQTSKKKRKQGCYNCGGIGKVKVLSKDL